MGWMWDPTKLRNRIHHVFCGDGALSRKVPPFCGINMEFPFLAQVFSSFGEEFQFGVCFFCTLVEKKVIRLEVGHDSLYDDLDDDPLAIGSLHLHPFNEEERCIKMEEHHCSDR